MPADLASLEFNINPVGFDDGEGWRVKNPAVINASARPPVR
jgi:hypothetical protein